MPIELSNRARSQKSRGASEMRWRTAGHPEAKNPRCAAVTWEGSPGGSCGGGRGGRGGGGLLVWAGRKSNRNLGGSVESGPGGSDVRENVLERERQVIAGGGRRQEQKGRVAAREGKAL